MLLLFVLFIPPKIMSGRGKSFFHVNKKMKEGLKMVSAGRQEREDKHSRPSHFSLLIENEALGVGVVPLLPCIHDERER